MVKIKKRSMILHAAKMVGRTIKSYALLSVTIVLSFALLLGYMTFSDTQLYNEYKTLMRYRRGDVVKFFQPKDSENMWLLLENLDKMENTEHYLTHMYTLGTVGSTYTYQTSDGKEITPGTLWVHAYSIPSYGWPDRSRDPATDTYMQIIWLDGQEHRRFILEDNQVLVSEAVFQAFGLDQQENPVLTLRMREGPQLELEVVGYVKRPTYDEWIAGGQGVGLDIDLYTSEEFIENLRLDDPTIWWESNLYPSLERIYVNIHSENPEQVYHLLETLQMDKTNKRVFYQMQDEAREVMRAEKKNKALICCALLLLLGINLYSSFTNALDRRRFEIGVRRALGASGFSIVRQFMYESLLVMLANVTLAVALVADVMIVYKYIAEQTPNEYGVYPDVVLYISPYSIAMFGVCAVALTLLFSLIFAHKATKVEIVRHLKAE